MEYCKITKFYQLSKAWYGDKLLADANYVDEIMLMDEANHELGIRWYYLAGDLHMRIESFCDGFSLIPDLLSILTEHENQDPSPETLVNWLKQKGIHNSTKTEQ